ncbi:MAG: hypothetical protein Q7R85_01785 [bacterium]|nr:hypothetical protein [bacterium]
MSWQVPVVLRLVVAYVIAQPLIKKLTKENDESRTQKFLLQFLVCLLLASAFAIWSGDCNFDRNARVLFAVGIANAFGAFCQWKSIGYSLSKNALFTVWDDIIAMTLCFTVLHEGKFLNPWIIAGIVTSFIAIVCFFRHGWRKMQKAETSGSAESNSSTPPAFYACVAGYSIIWGVAVFLMRKFAVEGVSLGTFLVGWYGGAATGAMLIFLAGVELNPKCTQPLTKKSIQWTCVLSVSIIASLLLQYWSLRKAPLVIVQPIFLTGEMIIPALIGLYFFKEKKDLDKAERWYFAIGITGGILLFAHDALQQLATRLIAWF